MKQPNNSGACFANAQPPSKVAMNSANETSKKHYKLEQQALELAKYGKLRRAKLIYRRLIKEGTNNYIVYNNLALICRNQGEKDEQIWTLKKSIGLEFNQPEVHNDLGNALQEKGKLRAAMISYKHAISISPRYPEPHYNLGNTLRKKGNLINSIACYRRAISLKPNYLKAHYNLGNTLHQTGNMTDALDSYRDVLLLKPNHPKAHFNIALIQTKQGHLEEATASYERALSIKPGYPEAHYNMGNLLKKKGELTNAIMHFKKAISLSPNHADTHWNLSLAMLLIGDYDSGLKEYEWRFDATNPTKTLAQPECPRWNGKPLTNKDQLLVVSEQGLGDTLQFIRYIKALDQKAPRLYICVQPKLNTLIQSSGINAIKMGQQEANKITKGSWTPLISTLHHLKISQSNPIITEPYLKASKNVNTKWRNKYLSHERPIIGINWMGNRKDGRKSERDFPIEPIIEAAKNVGGSIVSLQRRNRRDDKRSSWQSEELADIQSQIHALADSDNEHAFEEYAAAIANCDLIITTATTVCHLAAAMGIKTWVLLQKVPDWRWGLDSDTSFWYSCVRLFRQREEGNWDSVFEEVNGALLEEFPSKV